MDRRDHRAGRRVGRLPCVDRSGGEAVGHAVCAPLRCLADERQQVGSGEDADRLAAGGDEEGVAEREGRARGGEGLVGADERRPRPDERPDGVAQVACLGERVVDEAALVHGPDHLPHHDRLLGAEHEQLRDAVAAHDADRVRDRVLRLARTSRSGASTGPRLAASRSRDRGALHDRAEAVRGHPLVVEDLAEVAAAAVGQQHDDEVVGAEACGDVRRAATTAMPLEPPTSSPSSRASRSVIPNDSASETASTASTTVGS